MIHNYALRCFDAARLLRQYRQAQTEGNNGHVLNQSRLVENSVGRGHGLTTILPTMVVRRAPHRVTALHRLFGRSHAHAIE